MIKFTYNGEKYELGFTKDTVRTLDRQGFTIDKMIEYPVTYVPMLFEASFAAKHKHVKKETIDEIYKAMPDKKEILSALIELYHEPGNALFDTPTEGNAIAWTKE